MIDLIRIREGCGESEYDWFTTAEPKETNKKILENFFGELDEESNDGSGNIMYRCRNEEDAREKSMENSEWSIGYYWEEQVVEHWEPKVNDNGIPITYENKDELSAEDIESAGSSQ